MTQVLHLYELVDQYKILLGLESPEEYQVATEQLQGDIAEKAEQVALVIKTFEVNRVAIDLEIHRLQDRRDSIWLNETWLRNYLQRELEIAKMQKVEGTLATISLRKAPMSVEIISQDAIPNEYRRTIPETWQPDKRAMLDDKKANDTLEIPGIKFITDKRTLHIK